MQILRTTDDIEARRQATLIAKAFEREDWSDAYQRGVNHGFLDGFAAGCLLGFGAAMLCLGLAWWILHA